MKSFLKKNLPIQHVRRLKRLRDSMRIAFLPFAYARGFRYADKWTNACSLTNKDHDTEENPNTNNALWQYFNNHSEGHGIWKWEHYFPIYARHFSKFVNREPNILEIGIYSGGSLEMWKEYFGSGCSIIGVDIEPACKSYEKSGVKVEIGDQEDSAFWRDFIERHQNIDIIIDDGGHKPSQQIATLESLLNSLRPGGVYLCEDVHGIHHEFAAFASGLVSALNANSPPDPSGFQSAVHSIHFYPFVVVIEKNLHNFDRLAAPRKGTIWQPFFD